MHLQVSSKVSAYGGECNRHFYTLPLFHHFAPGDPLKSETVSPTSASSSSAYAHLKQACSCCSFTKAVYFPAQTVQHMKTVHRTLNSCCRSARQLQWALNGYCQLVIAIAIGYPVRTCDTTFPSPLSVAVCTEEINETLGGHRQSIDGHHYWEARKTNVHCLSSTHYNKIGRHCLPMASIDDILLGTVNQVNEHMCPCFCCARLAT